jgi:protein-disulfide isomerase/uncharacterized membrane protein
MKTRTQIALMACLLSVGAHIYLTLHYYPLRFGFATGNSVCSLNAKFDCDAVSMSNYSSFLGMPLSIWGAVTNLVLFFLVLLSWLQWSDHPERTRRWTFALASASFGTSIVMAAISLTQMQAYCLFCLSLYFLSAVIFVCVKGMLSEPFWFHFKQELPRAWSESKGFLSVFAAIPVLTYLTHRAFMENLGSNKIDEMVEQSIQEWQISPKFEFVAKPSLVMGPASDAAAMTLVEFADFRCGHCKHANYTLNAFVKSHPDVRFEFYAFPLDGTCNEKINSGNGMSCRLATAVYCAEKEGKGWALHDILYDVQDEVNRLESNSEMDQVLARVISETGLNWERIKTCLSDPASQDAVRAQAKQGGLVGVNGTPTLYANGRKLNGGQMGPVLEEARVKSLKDR